MEPLTNQEHALQKWRKGQASLEDVRALSHGIGKQPFEPGIPALVQLLDHEDEVVRYSAAKALGFDLKYKPATDKLVVMLEQDADEDAKDVAAGALKVIWQNTKEPLILKALAKSALTEAVTSPPPKGVGFSAHGSITAPPLTVEGSVLA